MKKCVIYTDGGARGNPGPAGIGVVIQDAGKTVKELSKYIGKATNNQAEYAALILGLEEARELGAREIEIVMDSELIVKQVKREYRVKDPELAARYVQVVNLLQQFDDYIIRHVVREKNIKADALVNKALDSRLG